jgi:replicative DNA helicase
MESVADLGSTVFSYILPQNREALDYALERLTLEHFRDGIQRTLWQVMSRFGERYGDVFPVEHLADLLTRNGIEETRVLLFRETYDLYAKTEVAESAFRYAVDGLRADLDLFQTGTLITTAFEILETGRDVDGVRVQGDVAAREYFYRHAAVIEERASAEESPEGDLRDEGERLLALYAEREAAGEIDGIKFGISSLDKTTNGVQPGELALIAAYTNEGKSQLLAQLAWDACVNQGRNVFFATSETVRDTTMRRILARHSRLPQFGYPQGLNAKAIQNATLTSDQRDVYHAVVQDFTSNSNIALCHISQLPRGATMNLLDQRVSRVNRTHRVDLVAIDYLQLLKAQTKRGTEREEYNEILRDTKVWAPAFDKGRGIAVVSPWQMGREPYKAALLSNGYTLASLSDTSEAEKTPDLIVSLLRPNPTAQEAVVQILKARDGPIMSSSLVHLDYRCSYIGESPSAAPGVGALAVDDVFGLESILNA